MDEVHKRAALLRRDASRRVEPDQADRAIVGEELAHLRLNIILDVPREIFARLVVVPVVAITIGMVPVLCLRIVEAELDALSPAFIRQFFRDVTPKRCCVDDVVVA